MLSDLRRMALALDVPLCEDLNIFNPVPAQRLFHALPHESRGTLAKNLLAARWAHGRKLDSLEALVELGAEFGIPRDIVENALDSPLTKEAVDWATRQAIDAGVFGSPTCVIDRELFWGVDRLWLLDSFLGAGYRHQTASDDRLKALGFPRVMSLSMGGMNDGKECNG